MVTESVWALISGTGGETRGQEVKRAEDHLTFLIGTWKRGGALCRPPLSCPLVSLSPRCAQHHANLSPSPGWHRGLQRPSVWSLPLPLPRSPLQLLCARLSGGKPLYKVPPRRVYTTETFTTSGDLLAYLKGMILNRKSKTGVKRFREHGGGRAWACGRTGVSASSELAVSFHFWTGSSPISPGFAPGSLTAVAAGP